MLHVIEFVPVRVCRHAEPVKNVAERQICTRRPA